MAQVWVLWRREDGRRCYSVSGGTPPHYISARPCGACFSRANGNVKFNLNHEFSRGQSVVFNFSQLCISRKIGIWIDLQRIAFESRCYSKLCVKRYLVNR